MPRPDFNLDLIPRIERETEAFVAWVVGTTSSMQRSLAISANFIMKLHIAALEAADVTPVWLYPAVDGIYICTANPDDLMEVLSRTFWRVAGMFIDESEYRYRFMIRGGVARGQIARGEHYGSGDRIFRDRDYANRIVIGAPLAEAYRSEGLASPSGLHVHESAASSWWMNQETLSRQVWRWWNVHESQMHREAKTRAVALRGELIKYLQWCEANAVALTYGQEALARHRRLATEYFQPLDGRSTAVTRRIPPAPGMHGRRAR